MEKIRECGSSVTYYGGRIVDNKSSELSPITKAIMQEIKGHSIKCGVCQPHKCPDQEEIVDKMESESDNFLGKLGKIINKMKKLMKYFITGIQFKLVKSNSCSSRLELAGTNIQEQKQKLADLNSIHLHQNSTQNSEEFPEESVRSLVNRLETGKINQSTAPRIIESKCIEKTDRELVTINSQLIEAKNVQIGSVDLITQVTVNNHISFSKVAGNTQLPATLDNNTKNKVSRNKNVDLAFSPNAPVSKITKEMEISSKKTQTIESLNENSNSFNAAKEILLQKLEENENEQLTKIAENKNNTTSGFKRNVSDVNGPRMVKWESLSKFDDKFYVTNDVKLKDKKKYHEMEFEEFEVVDPHGECYDSLNSK